MIEMELGFDAPQSHLSQPLAANFIHKRLGGALGGFLGGGGLTGALGGFLGGGGTTTVATNGAIPTTTVGPTWPTTFVGPGGVGIGGTGAGQPVTRATSGQDPCGIFHSWNPISGRCELDFDPGAGTGIPFFGQQYEAGGPADSQGMVYPIPTERLVQECPRMPNGKKGILWMGMQNGVVVCLPTGVNGKPMGLMRKNKPRAKAFISAAQVKGLRKRSTLTKKAKEFAKLTGQTCKPRGRGR